MRDRGIYVMSFRRRAEGTHTEALHLHLFNGSCLRFHPLSLPRGDGASEALINCLLSCLLPPHRWRPREGR